MAYYGHDAAIRLTVAGAALAAALGALGLSAPAAGDRLSALGVRGTVHGLLPRRSATETLGRPRTGGR